uniref:CSON010910 protein n=1 Tax=Culicoides sonorensis TaxID=179676 RepID=A0A336KJW3_CULSO
MEAYSFPRKLTNSLGAPRRLTACNTVLWVTLSNVPLISTDAICSSRHLDLDNDQNKRKQWIINSGNKDLQNLDAKAKRIFCEKHFEDKYLRKQFNRTTLHPMAVLKKYDDKEDYQNAAVVLEFQAKNSTKEYILDERDVEKLKEDFVIDVVQTEKNYVEVSRITANESCELVNRNIRKPKRDYQIEENEKRTEEIVKLIRLDDNILQTRSTSAKQTNNYVNDNQLLYEIQKEQLKYSETSEASTQTNSIQSVDQSAQTKENKILGIEIGCQTVQLTEKPYVKAKDLSPSTDDEDSYFCLNVIKELMKRLPPEKKSEAKLHMMSYLYKLEHS